MPLRVVGCQYVVALALIQAPAHAAVGCADEIHLKNGSVVLGQLTPAQPSGRVAFVVRREWALAHLPNEAEQWLRTEKVAVGAAIRERVARLDAWRADRARVAGDDAFRDWIDAEMARLGAEAAIPSSTLVYVTLPRTAVGEIKRAKAANQRLLRRAWSYRVEEPESQDSDRIVAALEAFGAPRDPGDDASLDSMLPPARESERRWLLRRAATEVRIDPSSSFLRYGLLLMPEGAAADPVQAAPALIGGLIGELLGTDAGKGRSSDPLVGQLRRLGERGQVGAQVTELRMANDAESATVIITLLVRTGPERWEPAVVKEVSVRADQVGADAAVGLAEDPQVKTVFEVFRGMGLGGARGEEMQRKSLAAGAASRAALSKAREQFQAELKLLALPMK